MSGQEIKDELELKNLTAEVIELCMELTDEELHECVEYVRYFVYCKDHGIPEKSPEEWCKDRGLPIKE